jgi:hypothetical protein
MQAAAAPIRPAVVQRSKAEVEAAAAGVPSPDTLQSHACICRTGAWPGRSGDQDGCGHR